MQVQQRGDQTGATGGEYGLDRWRLTSNGSAVFDYDRKDDSEDYYLSLRATTPDFSIGSNDTYAIEQRIHGTVVHHLACGLSNAATVTLSFEVKSTVTGTYCVAFQNDGFTRSHVKEYTVAASGTWGARHSVTVDLDTAGTWLRGNSIGLRVVWTVACGSGGRGTADRWNGALDYCSSNQVNGCASRNDEFCLRRVKLEVGSVATPWVAEKEQDVYRQCLPYFYRLNETHEATSHLAVGYNTSTTAANTLVTYPVKMLQTPTVSFSGSTHFQLIQGVGGTRQGTAMSAASVRDQAVRIQTTTASGLTDGYGVILLTDGNTNRHIDFDAEI